MVKPKEKDKKHDKETHGHTPQTPVAPIPPTEHVWHYGVNDHCPDVTEQAVKGFTPTHHFKVDFTALCELSGVVPHTALAAQKKNVPEGAECQSVALQSTVVDLATVRIMRPVLQMATQLHSLRLSSCCLDVEMLHLLSLGLSDSTVHTLHIDWNPLEIPIDAEALHHLPPEGGLEALDDLESKRLQKQAQRHLRAFAAQLEACSGGDLEAGLREVAALADPKYAATAMLKPLNKRSFADALHTKLEISSEEGEHIFKLLDMPTSGPGDGLVTLEHVKEVLTQLPAPSHEEELKDPIGAAFAAFLDGTSVLEVVSFRCCNLGRTEAQVISKTLQHSQHLRALNLWGNHICDRGAAALGEALAHYFGLQYLGLGHNFVTHVGLESICKVLGVSRIDSKEKADPLLKQIKEQTKDRDKKMAKTPPVPKKDANGRDRYMTEFYHIDQCEERKDPHTGDVFWVWTRNTALKTLVLEHNPIADAEAVARLQPFGVGDLVLRSTPVAAVLKARAAETQAAGARASAPDSSEAEAEAAHAETPTPPAPALSPTGGWRLVLQ